MIRLVDCKDYKEKITESECAHRRETAEKMLGFLEKGYVVKTATYSSCLNCNHIPDLEKKGKSVAKEKINPEGKVCADCGKPATEVKFNFKYDRCQYHANKFLRSQPDYQLRKRGGKEVDAPESDSILDINFCPSCGANLTKEDSITISSTNKAHKSPETSKLVYDGTSSRIIACVGCGKKLK